MTPFEVYACGAKQILQIEKSFEGGVCRVLPEWMTRKGCQPYEIGYAGKVW